MLLLCSEKMDHFGVCLALLEDDNCLGTKCTPSQRSLVTRRCSLLAWDLPLRTKISVLIHAGKNV